jgi:hypothetical protein
MSDYNPNRISAGKSTGGQFAAKVNGEQELDLPVDSEAYTSASAALSAEGNKPVTLAFAQYDDSLSEDQINQVLKGDWNDVEEEVEDNFRDHKATEAAQIAEDEINYLHSEGKFHAEWDDLDEDEQTEARFAVENRDDSDVTGELLSTTKSQYLAANIGNVNDELGGYSDVLGEDYEGKYTEERTQLISSMLAKKGMDTSNPEAQAAIRKLVEGTPGHWDDLNVDVVWNGKIEDAAARGRSHEEYDSEGRTLSFSNPEITLDRSNYGGRKATIPGTLSHTVTPSDPAVIDSSNNADLNIQNSFVSTEGWIK